ncbi:glycosyl hydrolase family 18 protein [Vibrio sp. Of7-15]|uniref:glycosyl hydrolase family 18 protein n=1 Tax=Vibrio sp. Of7-15 TaxID=2724879 RepID=UPI001EF16749|nr:glycosyl hydrolase family 18 protein [Vibrio sp. Of7-15]MCG7498031.1 glycosyl hydrolase family 18 protein [Vibrio sp. Of7-15]
MKRTKLLILLCIAYFFSITQVFASDKWLVGHFFEWNGQLNKVQTEPLTHLVYNHLDLTPDASIKILHPELASSHFKALQQLKQQQPELIILASIGGWTLSKHYPSVVADEAKSHQLIKNIGELVANSEFDGVSIDWRYPGISRESTVGQRDHDGAYLLRLLRNIRQAYPTMPLIVTVSVLTDDLAYLPVADMSQTVDFIEVLTLDLAGHWQNHTGHASPLHTPVDNPSIFTGSVSESIEYLLQQRVPANKLVISVPAFGHGWLGVRDHKLGLFQPSQSIPAGDYSVPEQANTGLYHQQSIHELFFTEHYQSFWDDQAKASYLFNALTGHFISFESTRSLKEKIDYIHLHDLAGISVQDLGADASLTTQASTLLAQKGYDSFFIEVRKEKINWFVQGGILLVFIPLFLFIGFGYRHKNKQKQITMTRELMALKSRLELLSAISPSEMTELKQYLAEKQQQYKLTVSEGPISAQLKHMMTYLSTHIQQLSNDPSLLSELHKISSNKNKLLYVQAEKGYTALHLHRHDKPEYIYSRLRQLKKYYDDEFLLQIHRSYLVHPQKVEGIRERSQGKFVVVIEDHELPIGGSFLAAVKQKNAHWFE